MIAFAISSALSFVASALLKPATAAKAAAASMAQASPAGTKVSQGDSAGEHPILVGRTRIGLVRELIACTHGNEYIYANYFATGHRIQGFHEVWLNDDKFSVADIVANGGFIPASTNSKYSGMIHFAFYTGDPNQQADAYLLADPETGWTPDHRCRGLAYISCRFLFGPDGPKPPLFQEGLPNLTAVVDGVCEVYDPRFGTTGWSDNPALLLAWYLTNPVYGLGLDYNTAIKGPAPDYPGEVALIAAANACDETVPKKEGGTEKRYTCNGALLSTLSPQDIIGKLLGAMHGKRAFDGEVWLIFAGTFQTPLITLTDDDLRAGMKVTTIKPKDELFNRVRGKFFGEKSNWQLDDFPVYKSAAYEAIDGRPSYDDLELPLTDSPSMAQRIAKIHLEQTRRQISVFAPCKFTAWRVAAGDCVMWTSARRGWTNKPFEVRRVVFKIEDSGGGPALCVDLDLAETAPGVYDWNSTEESIRAEAPPTTLPDVTNVISPANLVVTENLYTGRDGAGVKTSAVATWEASPDGFVTGYELAYKLRSESAWNVQPRVAALAMTIYDLAPGTYDFTVAAVNYVGNLSPAIPFTAELTGLLAPPQAPANMTLTAIGGGAYIRFDPTVDLDVQHGGWIVFRHSPAMSGATWDKASPLDKLEGRSTHAWLALKAGSYLARFLDSSGRYSVDTAVVVCKQASALTFTPASGGTLQEDSTFTGSKTNCSVSGGKLGLTAGQASGTYLWHAKMDLGSVKNVRLTVSQSTEVENATDTWDSAELCDSDESWDAAVSGNEAFAITYVRETDDDPSGSPTWSEWRRIDSAEFNAWGFDFKTELTAVDVNFIVKIPALAAVAEEVV